MAYRRGSRHIADWRPHCRQIDRNERARIMHRAERLERAGKAKGARNGPLGLVGLAVLKALLFKFLGPDGRCEPSYGALQDWTGLSRQAIADAIKRLVAAGILTVTRRLQRINVSGITRTFQATSLYRLTLPVTSAGLSPPVKSARHAIRKGSIAELLARVMTESTERAESNKVGNQMRTYVAAAPHDWRARARAAFRTCR